MKKSCLVCISTLDKDVNNYFNRLVKSSKFPSYAITYVCKPCQDKGVREVCIHRKDRIPHWSNEGRIKDIQLLLGEGEEERFQRENLAIESNQNTCCFPEAKVNEFFARPHISLNRPIRHIFIIFDPSAGTEIQEKANSQYGIVSIAGAEDVFLGFESFDAPTHLDVEPMIFKHLTKLRELPFCEDAIFVIDVESGTGYEASRVISFITKHFTNVVPLSDFERKAGTKTTNAMKKECMQVTRDSLCRGNMFICKDFVTHEPLGRNFILEKFRKQFLKFSRIVRVGKSIHHANQEIFTGKIDPRDMDDIIFSVMRAIRSKMLFYLNGKYSNFM